MKQTTQLLLLSCLTLGAFTGNLHSQAPFTLQEGYRSAFHIGVALNSRTYVEQNARLNQIVRDHFSLVVAENDFKWQALQPRQDQFNFNNADAMMTLAESQGKRVHGHVLVWHSQTPDWVFQNASGGDLTRDQLIERMQTHIRTVMTRYKGRVQSWDVVNEAFEDNGSLRNSPWRRIIGDDYLEIAFRTAHEVDPDAILVYNDYGWASDAKRQAIVAMANDFRQRGVPIHGLGIQGHWQLNYPSQAKVDQILTDAASTGLWVMVTELDIDVLPAAWEYSGADISTLFEYQEELDPYTDGLPGGVSLEQAQRYRSVFDIFLKHQASLYTITFWGVTDRDSWLNNFPVRGRTNHPMLFDRDGNAKPAFFELLEIAPDAKAPVSLNTDAPQLIPLHRFHRRANNSHFFTANPDEYQTLASFPPGGPWEYQGVSHYVAANHTHITHPVYRLFNRISGAHFYTANREEMLGVLGHPARIFSYEGIAFYTLLSPEPGSQPVHRFYAPPTGSHFFTISEAEKNQLQGSMSSDQLDYDGVAWFAYP